MKGSSNILSWGAVAQGVLGSMAPGVYLTGHAVEPDAEGDRVSVEIEPDGHGCVLTLTHALAPRYADYADRTRSGWGNVLDALARHLRADTR